MTIFNSNKYTKFEDLPVWQISYTLSLDIYRSSKSFPKSETFGLISQIRRSASSIGANIAEGFYKNTTQDLIHYLYISRGSAGETLHHLMLSHDLSYLNDADYEKLRILTETILKQLSAWINSLKDKRIR